MQIEAGRRTPLYDLGLRQSGRCVAFAESPGRGESDARKQQQGRPDIRGEVFVLEKRIAREPGRLQEAEANRERPKCPARITPQSYPDYRKGESAEGRGAGI